jgi:hypothetical protein
MVPLIDSAGLLYWPWPVRVATQFSGGRVS